MNDKKLCFIKYVGCDIDGYHQYEFLFTSKIDEFWGENFEYMPCCLCNELIPFDNSYELTKKLKTKIKLCLIQSSCCFSYQDAIDNIVSIAYEDISEYEEYPENGRLILFFGDDYEDVVNKLNNKDLEFE